MDLTILHNAYGKSAVRLAGIDRGETHQFFDLTFWIELEGAFAPAFVAADNSCLVATDTMKNVVYALARQKGIGSAERFALRLTKHYLDDYSQVGTATVRCEGTVWSRMHIDGSPHPHAFELAAVRSTCEVIAVRNASPALRSGFKDLAVLKTTGSGFAGFLRDSYTTLPETDDRILATSVEGSWPCADHDADWTEIRRRALDAIRKSFAGHDDSKSVQHTMHHCAQAVFAACSEIAELSMVMPNLHYIPANLGPFKLDNPNMVFVPTSEPAGKIRATFARAAAGPA